MFARNTAPFLPLIVTLMFGGCISTFEPRMAGNTLEAPRMPTAKEIRAGVEVSVEEYFSSHKSRRAFDADVGANGVLPLLIHVENKSVQDYRLERGAIRALLNGQPLADIHGLEAAEIGALRNPAWNALVNTAAMGPFAMYFGVLAIAGSASQTQKVNRQIEYHFERMELTDGIVKPGETATGFVFFKTPEHVKNLHDMVLEITLEPELLGDHTGKSLVYRLAMPAPQA